MNTSKQREATHSCTVVADTVKLPACAKLLQRGRRLDLYLAQQFPLYSRTYLSRLIDNGQVQVNGMPATKASTPLHNNDTVDITFLQAPKPDPATIKLVTQHVELIFQHEHFLIINKPAGLLVHKAHDACIEPTLVDWLRTKVATIDEVGTPERPGIIHRLDKDTSGLMVIALTNYAHMKFGEMFRQRTIKKTYHALVEGHPSPSGTIDASIGRHQIHKHKMTTYPHTDVSRQIKRDALTHYKVLTYFDTYSLVEAKPVTGRTHQIRVHFDSIGHSLIGDTCYNKKQCPPSTIMKRQALHAFQLNFVFDEQEFSFTQPVPQDFAALLTLNGHEPEIK